MMDCYAIWIVAGIILSLIDVLARVIRRKWLDAKKASVQELEERERIRNENEKLLESYMAASKVLMQTHYQQLRDWQEAQQRSLAAMLAEATSRFESQREQMLVEIIELLQKPNQPAQPSQEPRSPFIFSAVDESEQEVVNQSDRLRQSFAEYMAAKGDEGGSGCPCPDDGCPSPDYGCPSPDYGVGSDGSWEQNQD